MLAGAIMFLTLFILLLTGMPIACALGLTGLGGLLALNPILLFGVGHSIWTGSTSFVLSAVPLFILMGEIIQRSGISIRFYRALSLWLRWLPGQLLHTNIVACSLFAAISGSSVGTAATMGTVAIPEMLRLKYDKKILYGSLAAGGTLGILIPPSISMIIYGALVEQSIGHLFIAGIIPGLMMSLLFMAYIAVHALLDRNIAPPPETQIAVTFKSLFYSLKDILPVFAVLSVILGGLYLGWATPTEVAALGVFVCLLIAIIYRSLTLKAITESLVRSVRSTSMVLFVILSAQIFSFALFSWGATREIATWVLGLPLSPIGIWVLLAVTYLFLGMFIDAISMMILTLGVVQPIIVGVGFDPIWFGVTLTLLLEIGLITPPVGMNLYTIQAVAQEPSFSRVVLGSLPFVVLLLVGVILLTIFPELALWLPRSMLTIH